jgi:hypothetical protein
LYSLEGVEVRTLLNEVQEPEECEVTFDISELPDGMYFLVMQTGEERYVEKIVKISRKN